MAILILRTGIIYLALLLTLRLMGKRQLGEMELSEFVVASLIADMASHPLQDVGIPMINGLVPILTLFCCELLIAGLTLKSVRLRRILFGQPSMLVIRGEICQKQMRLNRFTADELMQELRSQGIFDLAQVEYAILETDGELTVMPEPQSQAVTRGDLGLAKEDGGLYYHVISDGVVLPDNLRQLGLDRAWLRKTLAEQGLRVKDVFLLAVDAQGSRRLVRKEKSS